jgi:hypothetical protein
MGGTIEYRDVLRLSPDEMKRLSSLAARRGRDAEHAEKRSEPRHTYAGHQLILIEIEYPGDETGTYRAVSWNVSPRGLGFLHGKFTYPGSRCRVLIEKPGGGLITVEGTVAWCNLLEGRVHMVGMKFDKPIDLRQIDLPPAEPS